MPLHFLFKKCTKALSKTPKSKTSEGRNEKVYHYECFKKKKKQQIKEDGIVMICKNVKYFWYEEQNNQFSLPKEDGNWINGFELQLGRFKRDIK